MMNRVPISIHVAENGLTRVTTVGQCILNHSLAVLVRHWTWAGSGSNTSSPEHCTLCQPAINTYHKGRWLLDRLRSSPDLA